VAQGGFLSNSERERAPSLLQQKRRNMKTVGRAASTGTLRYRSGELFCEGVSVAKIVQRIGTPAYIYSASRIVARYREFDRSFGSYPHLVCYSVKANGNLQLLRLLARQGAGFDIVSGGELFRVLEAGGRADQVVFSGVGKTAEEIDYALRSGILLFNCESESELRLLSERASRRKQTARVALRVNPHIEARTHPHIATGLRQHKFGIAMEVAERLYREAHDWPGLQLVGLSCHIGSQISDLGPIEQAVRRVVALASRLQKEGFSVQLLDAGGGLAVAYRADDSPPSIVAYCKSILKCVRGSGLKVLVEPGRALVADSGILVTRITYLKNTGRKKFLVVDAAMNDLIRPSLYNAYHEIRPVRRRARATEAVDVVGPICESGDFFARNRKLPLAQPDELLALFTVGAYGFALSSNYNARPRPAEVLVQGSRWQVARRRETLDDLVRGEASGRPR
jgi:diaminopimelate decarboxylase